MDFGRSFTRCVGRSLALPLYFCYLATIITHYLGYCKQKSDNFGWRHCGEKSPWRRFCVLRAVGGLVSMVQVSLVNAMSRETILRRYLDTVKNQYTHILLDCQPSLGMLTVNALAAANRIIIPVQAE